MKPLATVVILPLTDTTLDNHLQMSPIMQQIENQEHAPKSAPVETLPIGEYVKILPGAKNTYKRGEYDRNQKRYALLDCDDISRVRYVKKGKVLFHGFTY